MARQKGTERTSSVAISTSVSPKLYSKNPATKSADSREPRARQERRATSGPALAEQRPGRADEEHAHQREVGRGGEESRWPPRSAPRCRGGARPSSRGRRRIPVVRVVGLDLAPGRFRRPASPRPCACPPRPSGCGRGWSRPGASRSRRCGRGSERGTRKKKSDERRREDEEAAGPPQHEIGDERGESADVGVAREGQHHGRERHERRAARSLSSAPAVLEEQSRARTQPAIIVRARERHPVREASVDAAVEVVAAVRELPEADDREERCRSRRARGRRLAPIRDRRRSRSIAIGISSSSETPARCRALDRGIAREGRRERDERPRRRRRTARESATERRRQPPIAAILAIHASARIPNATYAGEIRDESGTRRERGRRGESGGGSARLRAPESPRPRASRECPRRSDRRDRPASSGARASRPAPRRGTSPGTSRRACAATSSFSSTSSSGPFVFGQTRIASSSGSTAMGRPPRREFTDRFGTLFVMRILNLVAGQKWTGAAAVVFDQTAALVAAGVEAQFGFVGDSPLARRLVPARLGAAASGGRCGRPSITRGTSAVSRRRCVASASTSSTRTRRTTITSRRSPFAERMRPGSCATLHNAAARPRRPRHAVPVSADATRSPSPTPRSRRAFRRPGPVHSPVVDTDPLPSARVSRLRCAASGQRTRAPRGDRRKDGRGTGPPRGDRRGRRRPGSRRSSTSATASFSPAFGDSPPNAGAGDREPVARLRGSGPSGPLPHPGTRSCFPASGSDQGQRAILEAMASGLPVVAARRSRRPGPRDGRARRLRRAAADDLPAARRDARGGPGASRRDGAARARSARSVSPRRSSRAKALDFYEAARWTSPRPPSDRQAKSRPLAGALELVQHFVRDASAGYTFGYAARMRPSGPMT